jgi:hypothetical protein
MKELKMYPYISTFDANYSPELVGLLSQQASWQMLQLRPQLQQLVAGSSAAVAAPVNTGTTTRDKEQGEPTKSRSAAGRTWPPGLAPVMVALLAVATAAVV